MDKNEYRAHPWKKSVEKEQGWIWGLSYLDRGQHCLEAIRHVLRKNLLDLFEVIEQIWLIRISI